MDCIGLKHLHVKELKVKPLVDLFLFSIYSGNVFLHDLHSLGCGLLMLLLQLHVLLKEAHLFLHTRNLVGQGDQFQNHNLLATLEVIRIAWKTILVTIWTDGLALLHFWKKRVFILMNRSKGPFKAKSLFISVLNDESLST